MDNRNKNSEVSLQVGKNICVEVNTKKMKYMVMLSSPKCKTKVQFT